MELITYKNFEWYVINESSKEKLLLMKDSFTKKMIKKYFGEYDSDYDVRFNPDETKIWWKNSYIRKILNKKFILDLNKNDLNLMKTILNLDRQKSEIEDYVRLLTIEEAKKIKEVEKQVVYAKRKWGYFTMSPCYFLEGDTCVFDLYGSTYSEYLNSTNAFYLSGVRPVISLKSNTLIDEEFKEEFRKYLSL